MRASFDGMRRSATANMNELCDVLKEVIELPSWDSVSEDLKERIIEAFNNSAQSVDIMNCLYDPNVEDDMNNLSDILSVDRLDELEKENDEN